MMIYTSVSCAEERQLCNDSTKLRMFCDRKSNEWLISEHNIRQVIQRHLLDGIHWPKEQWSNAGLGFKVV